MARDGRGQAPLCIAPNRVPQLAGDMVPRVAHSAPCVLRPGPLRTSHGIYLANGTDPFLQHLHYTCADQVDQAKSRTTQGGG